MKGKEILGDKFFEGKKGLEGEGNNLDIHGLNIEDLRAMTTGVRLNYICGVILTEETQRFKRMVFRITRGNAWTGFADIVGQGIIDPAKGKPVDKSVFVIVYPGGAMNIM